MTTFTFGIRFRFDTAEFYETSFNLALSEEEIDFVKSYLKENGDMPFWAFEFDNPELFNRMMEAHIVAILTKFGASPPSLTAKNPVVFSEHHHPKTLKTL